MAASVAVSLAVSSFASAAALRDAAANGTHRRNQSRPPPHLVTPSRVQSSIHQYVELTSRGTTTATTTTTTHTTSSSSNRSLLTINEIFGDSSPSNSSNSSNTNPLSDDLYQKCLADLRLADADGDSRLSNSEFVAFVNLNSYSFYDADGMNDLPLNFPLLFHSTACLCTLKLGIAPEDAEKCCAGTNGHIEIYGDGNATNMTEEEEAYTRGFCTEAWYSYGATMHPTRSPVAVVVTDGPTAGPAPSGSTAVPTVVSTTVPPVTPSTATPNQMATPGPTASPNTNTNTNAPFVNSTLAPTATTTATRTNAPTTTPIAITTASPVSVPTTPDSPPTSPPTYSSSTLPPAVPPPTTTTSAPTPTPAPFSGAPPPPGGGAILPIGIQYGISSNCGVTAEDVMNETNNTVKYGLESATASVLIGILNETYPRTEERAVDGSDRDVGVEVYDGRTGGAGSGSGSGSYRSGGDTDNDNDTDTDNDNDNSEVIASGVRAQLPNGHYKLFQQSFRNENDDEERRLGRRHGRHGGLSKDNGRRGARKLVYYSDEYPIVITDVEDVVDQACPPGQNCMRVMSTILVVLEEGDDPEEITQVVRLRIEQSFNDGSFFVSIPPDTIFCPGDTVPPSPAATVMPTPPSGPSGSNAPTLAASPTVPPVLVSTGTPTPSPSVRITSSPTMPPVPASTGTPTISPSVRITSSPTIPPVPISTGTPTPSPSVRTTSSPTVPPVPASTGTPTQSPSVRVTSTPTLPPVAIAPTASPVSRTTTAPISMGTGAPTQSPVGSVPETPTPAPSLVSTGTPPTTMDPLRVQITYDIANDCGLDAEAVFNNDGTTLKAGLEAATATTTIGILNTTFPRTDAPGKRKTRERARRQTSELTDTHSRSSPSQPRRRRRLVYYTEEYPVTIDRIIDITTDCAPGNNCLLIISTITVLPETGDDVDAISVAIEDGMKESFDDGTFFGSIPADTVVCPSRVRRKMLEGMKDDGEIVRSRTGRGDKRVGSLGARARLLKFVAVR